MNTLTTPEEINNFIKDQALGVIVFSTRGCVVCRPLKEKINHIVSSLESVEVSDVFIEDIPSAQGDFGVYTAPIVLVFVEGKESKRYSAAMDLLEFERYLHRLDKIMHG